jgi:peptidylprolyl isomerase
MKIGGKRRLFIPWQLAYGALGRPGPDAANPGIPAKADLTFDIQLVDQSDIAMPANHPGMGGMRPMPGGSAQQPTVPAQPATSAQPSTTPQPTTPAEPK